MPVHLRPDGRGTVRLKSPDPLAPPAVLFDYLRTDYDVSGVAGGAFGCAGPSPRNPRCGLM